MKIRFLLITLLGLLTATDIYAQHVAVKTNLLYDATANANLAVETRVAPLWTVELSGNLNLWKFSNDKQWRNWVLQPEIRRWFCNAFSGHFIAVHLIGGQYNIAKVNLGFKFLGTDFRQLRDSRVQGWMGGAGIAYGYDWILDKHWNLEAEIGIGWGHTRYDKYPCTVCGTKLESGKHHNYFGPTKAAINLVYVF